MDVTTLTLSEAKKRLNEAKEIEKAMRDETVAAKCAISQSCAISQFGVGKKCIIRTYSSGVHFGTLKERQDKEVVLADARRIWSWSGAFTLSAVANDGIANGRLSVPVDEILVTECIEVLPCSDKAAEQLTNFSAHE